METFIGFLDSIPGAITIRVVCVCIIGLGISALTHKLFEPLEWHSRENRRRFLKWLAEVLGMAGSIFASAGAHFLYSGVISKGLGLGTR